MLTLSKNKKHFLGILNDNSVTSLYIPSEINAWVAALALLYR
ncbi:protein of unknown function [Xenorhabdus bovienii]|uniref:Uncharacterized protein n=1 Tax=Xenorhabdus bovienii TaxID=40576 RepID=A0A0B6X9S5_XENBV|nr:hypothetical protein XBFFR1_2370013 [Xenorhabdus bovienii str. feltiae France]CDM90632.1 protein of unknown function [Xenorhabdus bovienii]